LSSATALLRLRQALANAPEPRAPPHLLQRHPDEGIYQSTSPYLVCFRCRVCQQTLGPLTGKPEACTTPNCIGQGSDLERVRCPSVER
jgi:hypothetical protein